MPRIKSIEVRLDVADVLFSAGFYATTLGLEVETLWPEHSPQFAILNRDGLRLQLGRREIAAPAGSDPCCTLWFDVEAINTLHAAIKEKAVVEWGPQVYAYGRREFAFRDPDGYLVILSEVTCDPAGTGV